MIRTRTPAASLAAAAAAVLGLAACGSSGGSTPPSAAPKTRTLNLSFLQDPGTGTTDPAVYYAGQGIILQDNIYQGLLQYEGGTATPTIIPDLATSWKASRNNTVYTLTLRHGVLFHDGTPFTSAAVEPSFARRSRGQRSRPDLPAHPRPGHRSLRADRGQGRLHLPAQGVPPVLGPQAVLHHREPPGHHRLGDPAA